MSIVAQCACGKEIYACTQKHEECPHKQWRESYGGGFTEEDIKIASLEKQIEKLKGLLREQLFLGDSCAGNEDYNNSIWQDYCKQHGI